MKKTNNKKAFPKYTPIRYHPYNGRMLTGYIVEAFDAVQTKPNCQTPIGETYPAYRLIVSGGSQSRIEMTEVVVPITERTHLREPDDKEYLEIPTEEIETELKKALKDTRFGAMPIAIDRSNLNNILAIFEQHRKIRSSIENEAELQCQQLVNVIVELIKAVQSSPEKQGNGFWRILQGMLGPKTVEEIENNGGIFSDYPKKKI